jgi:hypothetical protein
MPLMLPDAMPYARKMRSAMRRMPRHFRHCPLIFAFRHFACARRAAAPRDDADARARRYALPP